MVASNRAQSQVAAAVRAGVWQTDRAIIKLDLHEPVTLPLPSTCGSRMRKR
eukprot:COSAG06_NODE_49575_length_324_cov_1.142222_1_plen_50_part_10